jgi:hypothetical protein
MKTTRRHKIAHSAVIRRVKPRKSEKAKRHKRKTHKRNTRNKVMKGGIQRSESVCHTKKFRKTQMFYNTRTVKNEFRYNIFIF